jgi:hypothetical protein
MSIRDYINYYNPLDLPKRQELQKMVDNELENNKITQADKKLIMREAIIHGSLMGLVLLKAMLKCSSKQQNRL